MKLPSNYYKIEAKRVDDAAFPYYIWKCRYILYACFRPVDLDEYGFFHLLRRELSNTSGVYITIDLVLLDRYIDVGYLRYDIYDFFIGMLRRYTIPRILCSLNNPELYAEFKPDKKFRLFPNEPDYLKTDYGQFI